ncbi:MAG: hypothetical protein ACI9SX_000988 [Pseudoalteromonas tetraodonis]|jgi:hypothetical protein
MMSIVVAIIVLILVFKLLLKATLILVDQSKYTPGAIATEIKKIALVYGVRQV